MSFQDLLSLDDIPRGFLEGGGMASVFKRPGLPITIIKMVTVTIVAKVPYVLI